jgi:hypothetical protein
VPIRQVLAAADCGLDPTFADDRMLARLDANFRRNGGDSSTDHNRAIIEVLPRTRGSTHCGGCAYGRFSNLK